ncbi:glutathione-dependent formaldehyde-activating protein [Periconia macrospinosa]|uniref:Glutathione-dependent formaldehyde-activating protein n=1 Tax=Periconia macrospinosa TaxID=97972 RepID=A0A2V1EDV3_9PLEO|nr:glutathione-dependent formaldehyde-activating protein [Periconia macrospinosa]
MSSQINIHPTFSRLSPSITSKPSSATTLSCHCTTSPVRITLSAPIAHNHFCGCTQCWKPSSSLFSLIGVVPSNALAITSSAAKLTILDPSATIKRHACRDCGVHMFGRIDESTPHAFQGLDFVHGELATNGGEGQEQPKFAGFVSSVIESGFEKERMGELRGVLRGKGLEVYDCLSPELMDLIAGFAAERKRGKAKL